MYRLLILPSLFLMFPIALVGCGGGAESESVAQASPAAGASADGGTDYGDGGYGDDAGYGGGDSYGGGGDAGYGGGGYNDATYSDGDYGAQGMNTYAGGGYDSGGYGGAGYGGMQGSGPNFNVAFQFVRQNCLNCHGPNRPKGDVRLDILSPDFADLGNAMLWREVQEQLVAGTMPPPNLPQRPNPQQLTLVSKWIDQSLTSGGLDLDNQNYLTRAEYEFASGNEDLAMEFLYAHILAAEPPASDELLSQAGWFALGPRPALVTRYAVGVDLQAAETLTDLKPIGVNQMGGAGGGGGGGYGGGGYGGGERASSGTKDRTLYELTGDFGEALVGEFSSRWSSGDMGTVFAKIVPRSSVPTAPGQFAGANYGGGNYGGGGYGGDASYGGGGYGGGQSGGNAGTEVRKEILPGSLATPGLIFIGTGSQAELLERAKERGVDGLFIFDVEATQNRRTRLVNNDTRLRVITIDGKAFGATKTLMNTEVERAKQRDSSNDEVGKNVERLFALFDKDAKLASLPPLKPEHARTRVRQLLVDKQAGPLSKLFETRLFLHLGLISLDEAAKVYQIIFQGNEGEALAHGTEADRKLVLQSLLPE